MIGWYVREEGAALPWQRTNGAALRALLREPIAARAVGGLREQDFVAHVMGRRAGGAGPATAANDLTWIGVVLRAAQSSLGERMPMEALQAARTSLRARRLIGKSRRREFRLLPEALAIIERQPKTSERIFPFKSASISTAFARAARMAGPTCDRHSITSAEAPDFSRG